MAVIVACAVIFVVLKVAGVRLRRPPKKPDVKSSQLLRKTKKRDD